MKTKLLYLFSLAAGLTLTGCPDPICFNPEPSYNFAVTAHFTPEQDSIQVGDTLYLVSEFPSTMVPVGGLVTVDYSHSSGIGNNLKVRELLPAGQLNSAAVESFDYFKVHGEIYNSKDIPHPEGVQQLRYSERQGEYLLKVGIVPRKKGVYSLVIGNGISNGREGNECEKVTFQTTVANTDPHMHYLDDYTTTPLEEIPKIHYLVKVY
jgi:hypothetical protein